MTLRAYITLGLLKLRVTRILSRKHYYGHD